jgi:hypothetical protein
MRAQCHALADRKAGNAVVLVLRHIDPGRHQRIRRKSKFLEECANLRGILIDARLRGGKIFRRRRIADRPCREVCRDVAFGKTANGNRAIGTMCALQPVAQSIAADDQADRDDRGGHQPRQRRAIGKSIRLRGFGWTIVIHGSTSLMARRICWDSSVPAMNCYILSMS